MSIMYLSTNDIAKKVTRLVSSKVYWFGPRCPPSDVAKGQRLFELAGLNECFREGDSVAIKIHCGEWNNTGYLRPSIVAGIVETVKEYGGDPFVCETTTCYLVSRGTGRDLIQTATRNGFTPQTLGCPFVVADGALGLNEVQVPVENGNFLKHAYMAEAIADADALIVLTHFKGHPEGVYGGALKNVGIGCSSKQGKSNVHLFQHPQWGLPAYEFHPDKCKGPECPVYKRCSENCPTGAFTVSPEQPYAHWDRGKCIGCYECGLRFACGVVVRPETSMMKTFFPAVIADAAKGYIDHVGRDHVGFINYAIDISPWCDCLPYSDASILPNLGVFASKDIVALEMACLDASIKTPAVPGSKPYDEGIEGEPWRVGHEKFTHIMKPPLSQWMTVNAAVKLGLGSADYELIEATPGPRERYVQPRYRDHHPSYFTRKPFAIHKPRFEPDCYVEDVTVTVEELSGRPKTKAKG
jgi:uncharacterized Fe-S center protein